MNIFLYLNFWFFFCFINITIDKVGVIKSILKLNKNKIKFLVFINKNILYKVVYIVKFVFYNILLI